MLQRTMSYEGALTEQAISEGAHYITVSRISNNTDSDYSITDSPINNHLRNN